MGGPILKFSLALEADHRARVAWHPPVRLLVDREVGIGVLPVREEFLIARRELFGTSGAAIRSFPEARHFSRLCSD